MRKSVEENVSELTDFYNQLDNSTKTYDQGINPTDTILWSDYEIQIKIFETGGELVNLKPKIV